MSPLLASAAFLLTLGAGPEERFLRFTDHGDLEGCLQTAVVAYRDSMGRELTLVAALHGGDPSYYQALQAILADFDPLIHEGWVRSPGAGSAASAGEGRDWLGELGRLANWLISPVEDFLCLDSVYQWDAIDYTPKSFVNVDMDLASFRRACRARGELLIWIQIMREFAVEYLADLFARSMRASPREIAALLHGFAEDRRRWARFILAHEFGASNGPLHRVLERGGPDRTVTIHDRDRLVIRALRSQLDSGKSRIGIFYGADHMPDLERRLTRDLGFSMKSVRWLNAFEVKGRPGRGREVEVGWTELRSAGLRAVIAANAGHGAVHREGYNGLSELRHGASDRPIFVPQFAGLNFEHIFSGEAPSYGWDIFEPRRRPMALFLEAPDRAELRQERTEHWPLRTRIAFHLAGDGAIDFTVSSTPLEDAWRKHRTIGLFFASYIDAPEDLSIRFIGRSRPGQGDPSPRWIKHLPVEHGKGACHRPAGSDWDPTFDPGFKVTLAGGLSDLEYVHPFYFGVSHGKAVIFMFERNPLGGEIRFAQSPSGGGAGNPAWDFLYLARGYQVGRELGFRSRLAIRDFRDREDVIRTYEAWSGETIERPD